VSIPSYYRQKRNNADESNLTGCFLFDMLKNIHGIQVESEVPILY
jgi:hypothetical protein